MSNNWNLPKCIARSSKLSLREKVVVAVCLQYHNAGCAEKATYDVVKGALGFSDRTLKAAVNRLNEKNLLVKNSPAMELNHKELVKQKFLSLENYKDPSILLK